MVGRLPCWLGLDGIHAVFECVYIQYVCVGEYSVNR